MAALEPSLLFSLLAISDDDRPGCEALLQSPATPLPELRAGVVRAMEVFHNRLGTFPARPAVAQGVGEEEWLEAILRFAPDVHRFHLEQGIPEWASRAILADVGLQLRINRRVHGRFGLDTWSWLTLHMAGNIFRLGRLQFHLHRLESAKPWCEAGEWVLGVHIPEDGNLAPEAVEESFSLAATFFARHFPDKPVTFATCDSWMLDPYLSARLPDSNIAAFAGRFTLDRCTDAPTDAIYFTFRQRGLDQLDLLPRETSLQRVVLERIDDGGTWQLGHGHLRLPGAPA
ncbi:acyltransferase domain-containing protein [Arthrobacter sp. ISL-30]|uniref:acyltransferase domain-containing protein n=1 Tax=Arthrobacter sp. ISL-30 TaxID=2819109 RepID=UPI001BEB2623|nr:acyltransferase domain-containing protein [Arthrobacter sp. ISL-30]MBT2514105.1 DUF5596 domain-containing protein [Arthrobacter sp. ISL-30]